MKKFWSDLTARWADRRRRKFMARLEHDSHDEIQLMEYDGATYICHHGIPVVRTSHLIADAVTIVRESRESWVSFKLREFNINKQ